MYSLLADAPEDLNVEGPEQVLIQAAIPGGLATKRSQVRGSLQGMFVHSYPGPVDLEVCVFMGPVGAVPFEIMMPFPGLQPQGVNYVGSWELAFVFTNRINVNPCDHLTSVAFEMGGETWASPAYLPRRRWFQGNAFSTDAPWVIGVEASLSVADPRVSFRRRGAQLVLRR